MRAIWKGAVSFGLVHIPVKLYPATEHKDVKFRYLHSLCHTPIQYQRHCPYCQRDIPDEEIVRGYEYERGRFVILSDEDLEGLGREAGHTIDIIDFVELAEIDPVYFEKSYYLEASEIGLKAYHLLFRAMEETGKIAIARVIIRAKDALAAIRPYREGILILETMFYPEEVRTAQELIGYQARVDLHANELQMARTLIENLSAPFAPEKYKNEYRQALLELIRARVTGEEVEEAPQPPPPDNVIDLMEALKASIAATAREDSPEAGEGETAVKGRRRGRHQRVTVGGGGKRTAAPEAAAPATRKRQA